MRTVILVLFFLFSISSLQAQIPENDLWRSLKRGESFVMIRHAEAPGIGDPKNFELDDCSTQRNLSDEGLDQADQIGRLFRSNGVVRAQVYTSEWCRCKDTSTQLNLGKVNSLSLLNSFFNSYSRKSVQTSALEDWLDDQFFDTPLILVTHQVNITAFTEVYPESGEIVFIQRSDKGDYEVLGTIETL